MNEFLLFLCIKIMLITALFTLTRQFHFLQLNSYFNRRFIRYLKGSFGVVFLFSFTAVVAIVAAAFMDAAITTLVLTAVSCVIRVYYVTKKQKTAKKPLKFTARVKRLYITAFVIFAAISVPFVISWLNFHSVADICDTYECARGLATFSPDYAGLWVIPQWPGVAISAAILLLSPVVAILLNIINAPLEAAVRRYYISDAKRILKSKPDMKIIAVAGSYGKTSTKHILGRILSEAFNTVITPGSFNTPMGLVITIRKHLRPETEIFVAEMGEKQVGDIAELCRLAPPDMGVITAVGPQHLDTFGSVENVTKTCFELGDCLAKRGGTLYLNLDNEYICAKSGEYAHISYAIDEKGAAVSAQNIKSSPAGLEFDFVYNGAVLPLSTSLIGAHNVLNIMAAAAVALDLGVAAEDIKYAVGSLSPAEHRLQLKPFLNGALLIDDSYNANPQGAAEAMRVLGSFAPKKRIVVTPGLVELGEDEIELNRALGAAVVGNADVAIFVGAKRAVPLKEGAVEAGFDRQKIIVAKTFSEAAEMFTPMCDKDTVVLFLNDLPDNYA